MKKSIAFLLILIVLMGIIFITLSFNNIKSNRFENNLNHDKITVNVVYKNSGGEMNMSENPTDISSVESSNASPESGSNTPEQNQPNEKELPTDLYTKPCGSYFLEYSICAGVCSEGQCSIDDKSCYCKII